MSRATRLDAITTIVREQLVQNQGELVLALAKRGITATQATVSRDVRHLGLVKAATPDGRSRYQSPDATAETETPLDAMRALFQQSVTQVETGQALLVVKTSSGFGNAVAASIDRVRLPQIVGTIAGDDTILVVLKNRKDQGLVLQQLRDLIA